MRLYVDSNVVISYVFQEIGKSNHVMFQEVSLWLEKCKAEEHLLVLSDVALDEIIKKTFLRPSEVFEVLQGNRFQVVMREKTDYMAASSISLRFGLHSADSLHAAIALRLKCDAIVTWNLKDFEKVASLVKSYAPSELV